MYFVVPILSPYPAKRFDQWGPKSKALVSSYKGRYPKNFITIGWYLLKFPHALATTRLPDTVINGLTNRLKPRNASYNRTCPYRFQLDQLTLTPVRVRNKSYSKTDKRTDLSKTTFLDVSKVVHTSQIRSYLKIDFLHDAITSTEHGTIMTPLKWDKCESAWNRPICCREKSEQVIKSSAAKG